jgi:carboxylesterase type B
MATIIHHPTIGTVKGIGKEGIDQFLGLKYASLKDRLAEPEMVIDSGDTKIDATRIG